MPLIIFSMIAGLALYASAVIFAITYIIGSYIYNLITKPDQEKLNQEEKLERSIKNLTASTKENSKSDMEIEDSVDKGNNTDAEQLNSSKESKEKQSITPLPGYNPT